MGAQFLDSTARSAWHAATSQQAQLEGLDALFPSGPTLRYYTSGGTHLRTVTHAAGSINTSASPRTWSPGALVADTPVAPGTATYVIAATAPSGGTDILRADIAPMTIVTGSRPNLQPQTGAAGLVVRADAGLPATDSLAWIPPEGQFADVGASTLLSARPTGWPNSDIGGPFSNWSGAVWAPWFGSQGGYVVHGSGHLSAGASLWAGVWVWDVATATWVGRCVPSEPLVEGTGTPPTGFDAYLESTTSATAGHTYAPHTYDGLVAIPPSSGFAQGRLLRICMPGSGVTGAKCVHEFDLASPSSPPVRVIDSLATITTSYPATAYDTARGGFWCCDDNGAGGVGFVDASTWTETRWASVAFGAYGDQSLVYIPGLDCLVALGRDGSGGVNMSVRVCPIVSGVPQGWTLVTQSGTAPADRRCGGQWCDTLGAIVSYEAAGSYSVHKLTPPADLIAGTWAWTTETLTGASAAVPCRTTSLDNGAWSRFIWAPEIGCFFWSDSVSKSMQAWRLTGA